MAREIIVRGEGEARSLPDKAVIYISVEGEGSTQETAYAEAARPAKAIDALVERHSKALATNTTTALIVAPKTRWKKGESIRTGFRASRHTTLEVTDLRSLGDLFADLVTTGAASIRGPVWLLEQENDAHAQARKNAVADAKRRASTYADALELTITGVAWVSEPGLRHGREEFFGLARRAGSARGEVAEEPIEVDPEEITVRAAVEVGFEVA